MSFIHNVLDDLYDDVIHKLSVSDEAVIELLKYCAEQCESIAVDKQLLPRFSQFMIAAWALNNAQMKNELSKMGDWIGWSLSDAITEDHNLEINIPLIYKFLSSPILNQWPGFLPTMGAYFSGFYYYARERSAMKNIGEGFWSCSNSIFYLSICEEIDSSNFQSAIIGSNMFCWAGKESPEFAKDFSPIIEGMVLNSKIPREIRSTLCVSLTTAAGRFSSMPQEVWAKMALNEFKEFLKEYQKLQIMSVLFNSNENILDVQQILSEMNFVQENNRNKSTEIEFIRSAALRIEIIQPYLVRCMKLAHSKSLLQGLRAWYQTGQQCERLLNESLLITMPFGQDSYMVLLGDKKYEINRNNQILLEHYVRLNNKFMGTAKTVAFADNSQLSIPERPGMPNFDLGEELLDLLRIVYCPQDVEFDVNPSCQLVLCADRSPVQAIQLAVWGKTWPIAASLSAPSPDRQPLVIAIWGGGCLTEDMEINLVEHIFKSVGAIVDIYKKTECTVEDFLRVYQDKKYDVLWVASHGEFDHWYPEDVKLQIAQNETSISLQDLWGKCPQTERRRLLFLNICDGARSEEMGFLPKIGLAAGLAGSEQATISHLWPVKEFLSASFGVYLAHYLANGQSFFESYQEAVKSIRKTATNIASELRNYYGEDFELIKRLENSNEDYSPIQFFGSAAFFQ